MGAEQANSGEADVEPKSLRDLLLRASRAWVRSEFEGREALHVRGDPQRYIKCLGEQALVLVNLPEGLRILRETHEIDIPLEVTAVVMGLASEATVGLNALREGRRTFGVASLLYEPGDTWADPNRLEELVARYDPNPPLSE